MPEITTICPRLWSGPAVGLFTGYWHDPQATAAAFRGDFYDTGDRAYVDEDGYFWVRRPRRRRDHLGRLPPGRAPRTRAGDSS